MTSDLLSSMQKIYKLTGVEPDWVAFDEDTLLRYFREDVLDDIDAGRVKPYYSESQLWAMLPADIDDNNSFIAWKSKLSYGMFVPSTQRFEIDKDSNLHNALIDMVLWCIENGYIKKRGE